MRVFPAKEDDMSEQLPNPNPVEQGEMPDQRPEASSRQEADGVGAERPGAQRQAAQRSADPVRVASSV